MVPEQLVKFYYIYILRNSLKNFIYIGYSEDLKQRVISHNKGENKSTKAYLPLELIHYEAYKNKSDAKRREEYLKTNRGKTTLITMLKEYFAQQAMKSYQKKSKRNKYQKSNYVQTIPDWDNTKKQYGRETNLHARVVAKNQAGRSITLLPDETVVTTS